VRIGNPSLKPEYIDSFEAGFQTFFGKSLFSVESYYRITNNKVERVRSVYQSNVTLMSIENVGTDYALGGEFLLNFDPLKRWNMILIGNIYQYRVEGELNNRSFSHESFNWNARVNNLINLYSDTQIQITSMYNSPTVSSQGEREGYYLISLAFRQQFFNKRIAATLQVRDLFETAKYEYTCRMIIIF